jgi:Peptidase_C39 like family
MKSNRSSGHVPRRAQQLSSVSSKGKPSYLEQAGKNLSEADERKPWRSPARRNRTVRWNGKTVPHFCQGDPSWGQRLMNDDDSISQAGCFVTSVAMVLSYFGRDVDPEVVDKHMDDNNGYISKSDGMRDLNVALATNAGSGPRVTLARSFRLYDGDDEPEMHKAICKSLRENVPAIARLRYADRDSVGVHHFAPIVGRTRQSYVIKDPALLNGNDVVIETATRNGGLQLVGADILNVDA